MGIRVIFLGKTKLICNDCKELSIIDGKFVCTAQKGLPEILDILQPCPIAGQKAKGCEYCRGEVALLEGVWLEENTKHPKGEPDILMLCQQKDGLVVKRRIPYCPMCKRKFI